MNRFLVLLFGLVSYLAFLVATLYAIGFVGNLVVPKSIDSGVERPLGEAVLVNALLLSLFAVQHSVMARPWFKAWWTQVVSQAIERSIFVLLTSLVLFLLFWQWRPMPTVAWQVDSAALRAVLMGLFFAGWLMVVYSTFIIDHFDLFGLRQTVLHFRGWPYTPLPFIERSLYKWIRHPLMAGFIIAFWSAPTMSWGRLFFAGVTTIYILVAILLEERDLLQALGEDYRRYRRRTPMLLPFFRKKGD